MFFKFGVLCLTNGGNLAYNVVASGNVQPLVTTAYLTAGSWTRVKVIDFSVFDTAPGNISVLAGSSAKLRETNVHVLMSRNARSCALRRFSPLLAWND